MKIEIIGAGAIGSLVAAYLKLKEEEIYLVARPQDVGTIKEKGINISGVRGNFKAAVEVGERLTTGADLTILATKTQDIESAVKDNQAFLTNSPVLTTQNGIQAEDILSKYIPKKNIFSSIVMFGSTYLEPAKVVHNFEGSWIIGNIFEGGCTDVLVKLNSVLDKAFPVIVSSDIKGMKYLKIFVNANNCIPAVLGMSMQEAFSDLEISRISIALWKEGFDIVSRLGIKLVSLPGFPMENIVKLTSMPQNESAKIFSGIMTNLSKEPLYGSILQSIKRGRLSEIDYINGEFVRLSERAGLEAPLNKALVDMVHEVENKRGFLNKEELISGTKQFIM